MARLKGSIITYNNQEVVTLLKSFTDIYDYDSFYTFIPALIDDCLNGATGQMNMTNRPSAYKVFNLLKLLPIISTQTVGELMNAKRETITGTLFSSNYISKWTKVLRCASDALKFHVLDKGITYVAKASTDTTDLFSEAPLTIEEPFTRNIVNTKTGVVTTINNFLTVSQDLNLDLVDLVNLVHGNTKTLGDYIKLT